MNSFAFAVALLAFTTVPAFADTGVDLSFDGCTGPVTKRITAGSVLDAYTSVIDQSRVACAYQVDLTYANVGPTPADRSTCGGVETQVCITVGSASWLDLAGNEIIWPSSGNYGLGVNDPTLIGSICGTVVPSVPKTWGAVKSQYRNERADAGLARCGQTRLYSGSYLRRGEVAEWLIATVC